MKKLIMFICIVAVLTMGTSPAYAAKKDTKAPTVTKTNPADSSPDIMIESSIIVRFSEKVSKGKAISKISVKKDELTNVPFTYELKDNFLIITPKEDLGYNALYSVTIPAAAVKDKAGNNLKADYSFLFLSEKDPSKVSKTEKTGTKYVIEIEAVLQEDLTETKITYFSQILQKFGIEATFKNIYKAVEEAK